MTSSSASRKAKIQAAAPKVASAAVRRSGPREARAAARGANRVVVATVVVVVILVAVITAVILGQPGQAGGHHVRRVDAAQERARHGCGHRLNPGAPANVPTLDMYEDFQCPICARFEEIFGLQIVEMVKANQVKLIAHPLSFLDDNLRNDSSNRAANAAACASDAGEFLQYHTATFQGQPTREGTGYSEAAQAVRPVGRHHGRRPDDVGPVLHHQVAQPVGRVGADPVGEGRRQRHPDALEPEDVEVRALRWRGGLRDRERAELDVPAQDHLPGRDAVGLGGLRDRGLGERARCRLPTGSTPRCGCRARSWTARICACGKYGCSSIWFTAGVTPVSSMIRSRCSSVKLLTPTERTSPLTLGVHQRLPRLRVQPEARVGPVDQGEVDLVQAQALRGVAQGLGARGHTRGSDRGSSW